MSVKFEKNFRVISTPKEDIKFTFIMEKDEIKKKKNIIVDLINYNLIFRVNY